VTKDVATYAAGVRDRLAAAGWTIHDFEVAAPEPMVDGGAEYAATFWATRPGLVLNFSDHYWTERAAYDSPGAAVFDLWRAPPPWADTAMWGGAVAGALLALIVTVWVRRRAGRSAPVLAGLAVVGVALLLPSTLAPGEEQPMDSPWWGGFYYLGMPPALLSAVITVGIVLFTVARYAPVRGALGAVVAVARRWRMAAAAVVVVALVVAVLPATMRWAGAGYPPCSPAGVPAEPPAEQARANTHVKIFIANTTTDQERALIDAAIFRSRAGSLGELIWQPDSAGFRDTYCGGGPVPASAVASLPYYFDMELANTTYFPALLEEVDGLAGVLAVHRVRP
jgi:hypothetical protein